MDSLRLSDGGRLAYRCVGEGRPLVLVHGWAIGSAGFAEQCARPKAGACVCAMDLRGHSGSSREPDALTIEGLAADLIAFFEALDLRDAIAVGWSMGALVLWRALVAGLAGRVAGLIVVDMAPKVLNDATWSLGLKSGHDRVATERSLDAMTKNWPAFCKLFVPRIAAAGARPEARARIARLTDAAAWQDPTAMAALWRSLSEEDARPLLPRIATPTLVVHGAKSRLYGEGTARFIVDAAPNARLSPFRHSGHAPHIEEPEAFDAALSAFAADIGRPFGRGTSSASRASHHSTT